MNLSIGATNYFDKKNYSQNTNFRGRNATAVYNRPPEEISKITTAAKERLDGKRAFRVASGLCITVGKCLGGKFLFELIDYSKATDLWSAIRNNPAEAMSVIENILMAKDSQGKTYEEIVDDMIEQLSSKE